MNKHLKRAVEMKQRLQRSLKPQNIAWASLDAAVKFATEGKRRLAISFAAAGACHAAVEITDSPQGYTALCGSEFVQHIEKAVRRRGGAK